MKSIAKIRFAIPVLLALSIPSLTFAQHYIQTNLVSDLAADAPDLDHNLRNPWGLARSPSSPWWIADNSSGLNNTPGLATVYSISGAISPAITLAATTAKLVVTIPPPNGSNSPSSPTGMVWNGSSDFALAAGKPAAFIFVTEDGTISGWNSGVDATHAILEVDNSTSNAVYKGVTIGDVNGVRYLYVTNFRSGHVEVYDTNFKLVNFSHDKDDGDRDDHGKSEDKDHHDRGSFDDDAIPEGYAPFNVQNIGGSLFVTYAKQDAARHDDVAGAGNGYVDIYTTSGKLEARLRARLLAEFPVGSCLGASRFRRIQQPSAGWQLWQRPDCRLRRFQREIRGNDENL